MNESVVPVLALGLFFGLKHALDADHIAAVATMVSQHRSVRRSSLVGMFWGLGHTLALLAAGVAVIVLHVEIPERVAVALELCVACMLIGLGAGALRNLWRGSSVHLHVHRHGMRVHAHPHVHDRGHAAEHEPHTHHGVRFGVRPLLVGIVHGLAGSAALMLLILSTIPSPALGLAYIGVFGIGSIGGMMLMSAFVSLPLQFGARNRGADVVLRGIAACVSLGWGAVMVYEIGAWG